MHRCWCSHALYVQALALLSAPLELLGTRYVRGRVGEAGNAGGYGFSYANHGEDWRIGECGSRERQSPIDFDVSAPWSCNFSSFPPPPCYKGSFFFEYAKVERGFILHNLGNMVTADLMGHGYGGITYNDEWFELWAVNFHVQSEHTFHGHRLPIELQIVHKEPDSGHLLIVAVPFEVPAPSTSFVPESLVPPIPLDQVRELLKNAVTPPVTMGLVTTLNPTTTSVVVDDFGRRAHPSVDVTHQVPAPAPSAMEETAKGKSPQAGLIAPSASPQAAAVEGDVTRLHGGGSPAPLVSTPLIAGSPGPSLSSSEIAEEGGGGHLRNSIHLAPSPSMFPLSASPAESVAPGSFAVASPATSSEPSVTPTTANSSPVTSTSSAETTMTTTTSLAVTESVKKTLKVKIVSASGLKDEDYFMNGDSDPFCVCEIPGKPDSRVQTPVVEESLNPAFGQEFDIAGYENGDSLTFSIYDSDGSESTLLGKTTVSSSAFTPNDFQGEVSLSDDGGGPGGHLKLEIRLVPAVALLLENSVHHGSWHEASLPLGGSEPFFSAELGAFISNPLPVGGSSVQVPLAMELDLLSPLVVGGVFFEYQGSLTSPPCTERVTWMVRRNPLMASRAQFDALQTAILQGNSNFGNWRAAMPLMNRGVFVRSAVQGGPPFVGHLPTEPRGPVRHTTVNLHAEAVAKDALGWAREAESLAGKIGSIVMPLQQHSALLTERSTLEEDSPLRVFSTNNVPQAAVEGATSPSLDPSKREVASLIDVGKDAQHAANSSLM